MLGHASLLNAGARLGIQTTLSPFNRKFVVTTKRFLWQASQGEANKKRDEPLGRKARYIV